MALLDQTSWRESLPPNLWQLQCSDVFQWRAVLLVMMPDKLHMLNLPPNVTSNHQPCDMGISLLHSKLATKPFFAWKLLSVLRLQLIGHGRDKTQTSYQSAKALGDGRKAHIFWCDDDSYSSTYLLEITSMRRPRAFFDAGGKITFFHQRNADVNNLHIAHVPMNQDGPKSSSGYKQQARYQLTQTTW